MTHRSERFDRNTRSALIVGLTAVVANVLVFAISSAETGTVRPCSGPSPVPTPIDHRPLFILIGVASVAVLVVSRWAFNSWLAGSALAVVQLALSVGVAVVPLYLSLQSAPVCPS